MDTDLNASIQELLSQCNGDMAALKSTLQTVLKLNKWSAVAVGMDNLMLEFPKVPLKVFKRHAIDAWNRNNATHSDPKENKEKRVNPYIIFIKANIHQAKWDYPDLTHQERIAMLANRWNANKETESVKKTNKNQKTKSTKRQMMTSDDDELAKRQRM